MLFPALILWILLSAISHENRRIPDESSHVLPVRPDVTCSYSIAANIAIKPKPVKFPSRIPFLPLLLFIGGIEANPGPVTESHIRVGLLNVRSAVQKAALIHETIHDKKLDILILTETWLREDDPAAIKNDIAPPGYRALHSFRKGLKGKNSRGGGISLIFQQDFNCQKLRLTSTVSKTFENLNISLLVNGFKTNFAIIYRPPKLNVNDFMDDFTKLVDEMESITGKTIYLGDFNCPGSNDMPLNEKLLDILTDRNYKQHINSPTRFDNFLDLVITEHSDVYDNFICNIAVDDIAFSDHKIINFELKSIKARAKTETFNFRNFKKLDTAVFSRLLSECKIYLDFPLDPDGYVAQLYSDITTVLDKVAPLKTITKRCPLTNRPKPQWFNNEILQAKRHARSLERKYKHTKTESNFVAWKKARREATKLIQNSRSNYLKNAISDAAGSNNSWKAINNLLHKSKVACNKFTTLNAETLSKFFITKIVNIQNCIRNLLVNISYVAVAYYPVNSYITSFEPVTVAEAQEAIMSLNKPSPLDIIPLHILKSCSPIFAVIISRLANLTFETGIFPDQFKTAEVSPLLKKSDLDPSDAASYRPISNINTIGKLLEKFVNNRLASHVTGSNNFSEVQSGYRPFHSTETANVKVLNDLFSNSTTGQPSILASLDLSSAFDCVSHAKLLARLSQEFGVGGKCLGWLQSYLQNRCQYVKFKGNKSEPTPLQTGVPQGSVIGPLLFSIYVSPITRLINSYGFCCHSYADDTSIYFCFTEAIKLETLNKCTVELKAWLMSHGLMLNPTKSEVLVSGTPNQIKKFKDNSHTVIIANETISPSDKLKLLGVTFDSTLSFEFHIQNISRSVSIELRALRHIRKCLDKSTANIVATSIISSKIDYCNSVLTGVTAYNLKRLQRLQTYAAKIVLNDYQSPQENLLQKLHWLPIKQRIDYKLALLAFKTINTGSPSYLRDLLNIYVPNRSLRSADQFLLQVPHSRSTLQDRAFSVAAPKVFNSLPLNIRKICFNNAEQFENKLFTFKKMLKTHFFTTLTH